MTDDLSKAILRKLFYDNRVGKKHISLENLKTGFPSHIKGDVDKKLKKLVKDNLVLQHPMVHSLHSIHKDYKRLLVFSAKSKILTGQENEVSSLSLATL